jgi:dolichyl-phosphate-mannose-protein mannosyltransferase
MPPSSLPAPDAPEPLQRQELVWVGIATLIGLLVRGWRLDLAAIEHFDEAVYASNLWFTAEEGFQYPFRELYAPYLWPTVLEWWQVATGAGLGGFAVIPTLLCGVATIPSVWWVLRQRFGPLTGLAAAWLVGMNGLHVTFSRTALTDVPFTVALLWAMHAVIELLITPTVRQGVIVGLWTGLAWSLKYSGWLPLVVLLSAAPVFALLAHQPRAWWRNIVLAGGTAVVTAVVCWLPVLWDCQSIGGYAAVSANHAGYIRGWSAWGTNFLILSDRHSLAVLLTAAGWLFAGMVSRLVLLPLPHPHWQRVRFWMGLYVLMFHGSHWAVTLMLGLIVIGSQLNGALGGRLAVPVLAGGVVLATWYFGLAVTTPLYTPYPRLLLPLILVTLSIVAWGWLNSSPPELARLTIWQEMAPRGKLILGVGLPLYLLWVAYGTDTLNESRTGYRDAARSIAARVAPSARPIVQVYGLPAVVLGLRADAIPAVVCGGPELAARVPEGWLVIETRADLDPHWRDGWAKVADRYELVERIPVQPSSVVRFDRPDPNIDPNEALLLYRRK